MCEMLDMTIYGLETETTHPKRLFDNLSFLDFRKNEKKLGGICYCFLAKNGRFPYEALLSLPTICKRDFVKKLCLECSCDQKYNETPLKLIVKNHV